MASMQTIMAEVTRSRVEHGWTVGETPDDLAKSIIIEAAELLEIFRWKSVSYEQIAQDSGLRTRVAEELADVLIYALSLADHTGIDPAEAVRAKLLKNNEKYPLPE